MLTPNQEKFVQGIIEGKSQIDAYREAYPKQRSADKTCYENASRLMNNSKIKARLTELRNQMMSPSIMSAQERLELLSRMARGEERERIVQFVEGERFEYEIPASLKTRREAIDTMNKMTGEYVQKIAADIDTNVTINIELSDDE
jgi:phage terminase small subunit